VIDNASSVLPHFFADDTQLSGFSSPRNATTVCRVLERCVDDVQVWCSSRRLQLNPDKSELIWFGSQVNLERLASTDVSVRVGQTVIKPSDRVRDLGVILDSSLSMRQHIANVTSTCFFHLRRLRRLGKVLDRDSRNRLVCAFILTHALTIATPCLLDCQTPDLHRCNVLFTLLLRPRDHVTATLMTLHWLPVQQHITYKLCSLMDDARNCIQASINQSRLP